MPYILIRGNLASYSQSWRVLVSGITGEESSFYMALNSVVAPHERKLLHINLITSLTFTFYLFAATYIFYEFIYCFHTTMLSSSNWKEIDGLLSIGSPISFISAFLIPRERLWSVGFVLDSHYRHSSCRK